MSEVTVSYDPYQHVDWSDEQGYYQFHAHVRRCDDVVEQLYERTGHRGAVIGDAPCRDDHNQVHPYWPWETPASELTRHHDNGMVAIPGGERDGGGVQHTLAINSLYNPNCGADSQTDLIEGICTTPLIGQAAVAVLAHPSPEISIDTYDEWIHSHEHLIGQEGWQKSDKEHWEVYHEILDRITRQWWHVGGDDFSDNLSEFNDARDVNRCYIPLSEHTVSNVISALVSGAFYVTHAPDDTLDRNKRVEPFVIESITTDEETQSITVETSEPATINWISSGGLSVESGPTLHYGEYPDALSGSWAYAHARSGPAETKTQPFSFGSVF